MTPFAKKVYKAVLGIPLGANGLIGGYLGGEKTKKKLLDLERQIKNLVL